MQPARKDDPNPQDTLPDPRLNPMINPRLGKNLGRWASVYYTTPPERRDQAVLELVRELESGAATQEGVASASCRPEQESEHPPNIRQDEDNTQRPTAPAAHENPLGPISAAIVAPASCWPNGESEASPHIPRDDDEIQRPTAPAAHENPLGPISAAIVAPASCRPNRESEASPHISRDGDEIQRPTAPAAHENPLGPISAAPEWRFCGHCGSPLKKKVPRQPNPSGPLLGSEPRPWLVDPTPRELPLQIEDDSVASEIGSPTRRRVQILLVLLLSLAIGAWGLWHIRFAPAPPSTARVIPIVKQIATPTATIIQPRIRQTVAPPAPLVHDFPSKLRKPAAGTPIGCTSDHLSTCRPEELYRKSMGLADGIDARFLAYDKRMNQLLREATTHSQSGATTRPHRLRQANYSAQLWERLQLKAYSRHEKQDALKLRAELNRRIAAVPKPERNLLHSYESPQSCLELHYIADDLRRLAAKLQKSPSYALRASARRISD